MNFKDIGKSLKNLGKSKAAKEIKEVTEEGLESLANSLLEKNNKLLNSVGNQFEKEVIDTAGALSHLPEVKPVPKGALRNKGESVFSKTPIRVMQRTGKYRSGYDVAGTSTDFNIEGVIKSKNANNYLIGSLDAGMPGSSRYLLSGKPKKTSENKRLKDKVSFNINAQNYIDNGVEAPYWVRKRAEKTNAKPKQEVKNRRKGNREIKEIPINNSTQQEQQLLLEAPKKKASSKRTINQPENGTIQMGETLKLSAPQERQRPRAPRKKQPDNIPTNTEPIQLPGPVKSDKSYNKLSQNEIQSEQVKPIAKNNKIDISLDDFKTQEELKKMDIESNEISVEEILKEPPSDSIIKQEQPSTKSSVNQEPTADYTPQSDNIVNSQLDELEKLKENGTISQEDYENSIDKIINIDSQRPTEPDLTVNEQIMDNKTEEVGPKQESIIKAEHEQKPIENVVDDLQPDSNKKQFQRQQKKTENEKNSIQRMNTQEQLKQVEQDAKSKVDDSGFNSRPITDDDIMSYLSGDQYDITLRNSMPDSISIDNNTYEYLYDKDGRVALRNMTDGEFLDAKKAQEYVNIGDAERTKYLAGLKDEQWNNIFEDPEKYGFENFGRDKQGYDKKIFNQTEAYAARENLLDHENKNIRKAFDNEKDKKARKKLEKKRDNLDIEKLEVQRKRRHNEAKIESRIQKQDAASKFNKELGLDKFERGSKEYNEVLKKLKGTDTYNEALDRLKHGIKTTQTAKKSSIKSIDKEIDSKIRGLSGKAMDIGKAINIGMAAKAGLDKYKEARAEGKSAASSAIRAGVSMAVAEVLGPVGTVALSAAQAAPKLAVAGADALYKEYRKMNSASNFVPLGGVNFQDSQELATMRQSGMELAKMSQYNLEQSLMGAEAKHLHR